MADQLVGSEIIKLAGEVKAKMAAGAKIYNLTIGDFNPQLFPIPEELKNLIVQEYEAGSTNYPASNGMPELRQAASEFIKKYQGLDYSPDEFLISGGARPLIYAVYQTILDPDDKVVFPVPSWNNNHYSHLTRANCVMLETQPEDNFMPTAELLKPHLQDAQLLALCSPLNPTGTIFSKEQLKEICDLVVEINKKREGKKPLYILFDQIYWLLCKEGYEHADPVTIRPELKPYTLFVDGMSKAFAATGVRVGWAFGPQAVINKMKAILGHIGAWSPKAEQLAAAKYLQSEDNLNDYLVWIKNEIKQRLDELYASFSEMKNEGYAVDVIPPQGGIYLTLQFKIKGLTTAQGKRIETTEDITSFILDAAGLAIVPFYAFGSSRDSNWYRLSVGTAKPTDPKEIASALRAAFDTLS